MTSVVARDVGNLSSRLSRSLGNGELTRLDSASSQDSDCAVAQRAVRYCLTGRQGDANMNPTET